MKYSILDGAFQSDSLAGVIIGPLFLAVFLFYVSGLLLFYWPALIWHGFLGLGSFALTGKGISRPVPKFLPTVFKGWLMVLTLGLAGPLLGPLFKRFFGLGGRFGGGGAVGKW